MSQIVLPFKQGDKVLEIGGGVGTALFHPNMDIRPGVGVEIVHDCRMIPWPIPNESFDGVFGKFLIEHPSWRSSGDLIKESFRVLKLGGMMVLIGPNTLAQCQEIARRNRITIEEAAMLYGGQEEGDWNTHRAAFSMEYMKQLCLQAGFAEVKIDPLPGCATDMVTVATKGTDLIHAMTQQPWFKELEGSFEENPESLRLNLGSFTVMAKNYVNIDVLSLEDYARQNGYAFRQWDLRKGIPYSDGSVDALVSSHLLEHLSRKEGEGLLKEIVRVLKPGAPIRIAVPDTRRITEAYLSGEIGKWTFNEGVKNAEDNAEAFWSLLTSGHATAYDEHSLYQLLSKAGLTDLDSMGEGQSKYGAMFKEVKDVFPELSLYAEGKKPLEPVKKKLRIALISTPMLRVFPDRYGGLEQVVGDLGEVLAEMGHEITIFATKGSRVKGCKVVETVEAKGTVQVDWLQAEQEMYEIYKDQLRGFDIIHGMNWFGFEYLYKRDHPEAKVCHTHHGHLNWKTKPCDKPNLIAISDWMVKVYASQGWTVRRAYNGVDLGRYQYSYQKGSRLLFVGRLDTFKQPDVGIMAAKELNMGLDIVGGSFVQDKAFLERIKSQCDGKQIALHLDASHEEKIQLYQKAKAVLFPSRMGEPFGLIVPEANACGSFVIGTRDGAIPELIREGVNGFVVGEGTSQSSESDVPARKARDVQALVDGVKKMTKVHPKACRREAMKYSREAMAQRYVELYEQILGGSEW